MVPHSLVLQPWVTPAFKRIDSPSLTHFQLPPHAFKSQPIKKWSLHFACPEFNTRNFTYRQFQDLVCVTSHDRIHHPSHFMHENLECLSHMVPSKAQRLCSRTSAVLWGWKRQDFWVGVLSHSFLIKMLLHHWKFLSVPNDFSPVIEPLVKTKSLGPKSWRPLKPLAFSAIHVHVLSECWPWGAGHFIRQKHK